MSLTLLGIPLELMNYEQLYYVYENEVLTKEEKERVLYYLKIEEAEEIWKRVNE